MKKTIFLDLDGVLADLISATIELLKNKPYFINNYKNNPKLFDGTNEWESFVWNEIEKAGFEFWENLEKYDYADKLIEELEKLGEVVFLTSVGNTDKYTLRCANAAKGKVLWMNKYFSNRTPVITKAKYLLSNEHTILIDDLPKNIIEFTSENRKGKAFLWNSNADFDEQILKIKGMI